MQALKFRLLLFFVLTAVVGCRKPPPTLVPVSEAEALMTYQNSAPRFSLKVFMYAPGNLLFQVRNLLPDFRLAGLPDITSPTGRVLQARLAGPEELEFNVLLPRDDYARSDKDLQIEWILAEKGPKGFLRSEGTIVVDIVATPACQYLVREVRYLPAGQ